jgi:adenylate cyclase
MEPKTATPAEKEITKLKNWKWTVLGAAGAIIVIIGALAIWNFYLRSPSIEPASVERMAYPLPDKPSIAVLPFNNMSGDPEQDYIGDGLSENIISALSVSSELFVIARNSTFTYKGKPVKVQQVAEDLGVQYVLEGSIQKSGNKLRVTAQFIDALSGHHLWSEVYDREMKNLFELQDEITKKIMVSLQVKLSGSVEDFRLVSKSTDNLEAWKHFNKGGQLFNKRNPGDNAKAREHFEAALDLDPEYLAAMGMVAGTHLVDCIYGWSESPLTSMKLAIELAQKTVELDEQDPVAHAVLGIVFLHQRQHEKAITEGKRAITLNPNYAHGHFILAMIMRYSGRFEEAITLAKKVYRLAPNIVINGRLETLGASYIFLRNYEEALEVCKQMEESAEKALISSWIYQELGKEEQARAYMAKALEMSPDLSLESIQVSSPYKNPAHLQRELDAYRKAGMPEKAPGTVQEKPSIAVLPFDDLSPEKDQEYFVLGLSEEILNSLAQIPDLSVIAKTSSFSFRGKDKTIQEIADVLDVDHILEGSVRKAGNALRITAQLIEAGDGSHLWSKTYDKEFRFEDVFSVQEDIATRVADGLKLTLGIDRSLKQLGGTHNAKAYELYLVAKGQLSDIFSQVQTEEEASVKTIRAQESLDAAIALDPEFALAWAYKALTYWHHLAFTEGYSLDQDQDPCLKAALRAIEMAPNLAEAHYSLGLSRFLRKEYIEAELAYRKAMELVYDPMSAYQFGFPVYYFAVGKFKEANEIIEAARQIDPLNHTIHGLSVLASIHVGDVQRAEEKYQLGKEEFGDQWLFGDDIITITRLGAGSVVSPDEIVASRPIYDTVKELLDSPEEGLEELHRIYSSDHLISIYPIHISVLAAYFGDQEFALEAMKEGINRNSADLCFIWGSVFHDVRQLPGFKEFIREIGLVDYWKEYGWSDLCRPVGENDFECD